MRRVLTIGLVFIVLIGKGQLIPDTLIIYDTIIPSPWLSKNSKEWREAQRQYFQLRVKPHLDSSESNSYPNIGLTVKPYPKNKFYYLKFYAEDSIIAFEGLRYNHQFVGQYISYHKNGQIKTKGNHTPIKFKRNGVIKKGAQKDGTWTYFSKSGKIIRKEKYKNGKLKK